MLLSLLTYLLHTFQFLQHSFVVSLDALVALITPLHSDRAGVFGMCGYHVLHLCWLCCVYIKLPDAYSDIVQ